MPTEDDLVNRENLRAFLADRLGSADTFSVERHDQGFSNETLFLTWGECDLVLRRPPPGASAETAEDLLREYEVMDALQDSEVAVPTTVTATGDTDIIGCPFYVMERLDGEVVRYSEPERFSSPEWRRGVSEALVDTLANIHGVDYEAVGLGDFGRPERFTGRQVERWRDRFEYAAEETATEREVPAIEEVREWLVSNVPENRAQRLVHGDYKLNNVVFGPGTPPEIVGVLDWEMSTLGDPLCDLGWLLFFWVDDESEITPLFEAITPTFLTHDDYFTREEILRRYEQQTGVTVENFRFYRVLAVYKMAALGELFFASYVMGYSDREFAAMMEDGVPELADHALSLIESA
jgi:aminoglycoside phosphotransferase (APT) family kinase protein